VNESDMSLSEGCVMKCTYGSSHD